MNSDETVQNYYSKVMQNLESSGFSISRDIIFEKQSFDFVAMKKGLEINKLSIINTSYFFSKPLYHDINSLKTYSKTCFKYSLKKGGIHLPRGIFYGVFCFPVAIVDSIDPDTVRVIHTSDTPAHWAAYETLVVVNLASKELYYSLTTPAWGQFYFEGIRQSISCILQP